MVTLKNGYTLPHVSYYISRLKATIEIELSFVPAASAPEAQQILPGNLPLHTEPGLDVPRQKATHVPVAYLPVTIFPRETPVSYLAYDNNFTLPLRQRLCMGNFHRLYQFACSSRGT
jgi:hypothetical protein